VKWLDSLEEFGKKARLVAFKPLLKALTSLGMESNHISVLSLLSGVSMFYFLLQDKVAYSIISLILFFFLDAVDGTLARYQKKESDKGKFMDMITSSVTDTLLVLALIINNVVNSINGAVFVYLMLITIIFAIIIRNKGQESDWMFHAKAGPLPHTPKILLYIFFILWGLGIINIVNELVFVSNVYLFALSLAYFAIIWRKY